jgi:hypothetical protein
LVRLYNAAGLDFDVLAERGMSIGGWPLAAFHSWISPVGAAHPAYLEEQPLSWLRNWPGGFLTPCGLTQVGSPCQDGGEALGIHGRAANLPAHNLRWGADWQGDDYLVWVEGTLHESRVFGENLTLQRRIWTKLDEAPVDRGLCEEPRLQPPSAHVLAAHQPGLSSGGRQHDLWNCPSAPPGARRDRPGLATAASSALPTPATRNRFSTTWCADAQGRVKCACTTGLWRRQGLRAACVTPWLNTRSWWNGR